MAIRRLATGDLNSPHSQPDLNVVIPYSVSPMLITRLRDAPQPAYPKYVTPPRCNGKGHIALDCPSSQKDLDRVKKREDKDDVDLEDM